MTEVNIFKHVDSTLGPLKMDVNNASYIMHVYETKTDSRYNVFAFTNAETSIVTEKLARINAELEVLRSDKYINELHIDDAAKTLSTATSAWTGHDSANATADDDKFMTPGKNVARAAAAFAKKKSQLEARNLNRQLERERRATVLEGAMDLSDSDVEEDLVITLDTLRMLSGRHLDLIRTKASIDHQFDAKRLEQTIEMTKQSKLNIGVINEINLLLNRVWMEGPMGMIEPSLLARIKSSSDWTTLREYQLQSMGKETWAYLRTLERAKGHLDQAALETAFMTFNPRPKMLLGQFDLEFQRLRRDVPDLTDRQVVMRYVLVLRDYFNTDVVMAQFLESFHLPPSHVQYVKFPDTVEGVRTLLADRLRATAMARSGSNVRTLDLVATSGKTAAIVSSISSTPISGNQKNPEHCWICGEGHRQFNCRYVPKIDRKAWHDVAGKTKSDLASGEIKRTDPDKTASRQHRGGSKPKAPPPGSVKRPSAIPPFKKGTVVSAAVTTEVEDQEMSTGYDSDFDLLESDYVSSALTRNFVCSALSFRSAMSSGPLRAKDRREAIANARRIHSSRPGALDVPTSSLTGISPRDFRNNARCKHWSMDFTSADWIQLDQGSEISLGPEAVFHMLIDPGSERDLDPYRISGASLALQSVIGNVGDSPAGPIFKNDSPGGRAILSRPGAERAGIRTTEYKECPAFPEVVTAVTLFVPCRDYEEDYGFLLRFGMPVFPDEFEEQPPGTFLLVCHKTELETFFRNVRADYGDFAVKRTDSSSGRLRCNAPRIAAVLDTAAYVPQTNNLTGEVELLLANHDGWHDDGQFFGSGGPFSFAELERLEAIADADVVVAANTRLQSQRSGIQPPTLWAQAAPRIPEGYPFSPARPVSPHPSVLGKRAGGPS